MRRFQEDEVSHDDALPGYRQHLKDWREGVHHEEANRPDLCSCERRPN